MPNNVSFEEASTVEPLAVGVHAVNPTPIRLGDTAVIIGVGVIGLMALQATKLADGKAHHHWEQKAGISVGIGQKLGANMVFNA